MAGILVPPFKLSGSDSIIPRSSAVTKIFGNSAFSLSVGGTSAATAQLDAICDSSSRVGHIVKGASSQSADLMQLLNSSSNVLTRMTSGGYLGLAQTASTISAQADFISNAAVTHNVSAAVSVTGYRSQCTLNYTVFSGVASTFFLDNTTYKNDATLLASSLVSARGYVCAPSYTADTSSWTITSAQNFLSSPTLSRTNSGTLTVTNIFHFRAAATINTGTSSDNRIGFGYAAESGSGSIGTDNVGFDCADLTMGTNLIAYRSAMTSGNGKWGLYFSGNAASAHTGKLRIGDTTAPTAMLELLCDSSTTVGQVIKGASSQTGNLLSLQDSSANELTTLLSTGEYRYQNSNITLSSIRKYFHSTSTITGGQNGVTFFTSGNTISYTAAPGFGLPPIFFQFAATTKATTTNMTMFQPVVYASQGTMTADGVTWTGGDASGIASFVDQPTYSVANSGTFATYTHNAMRLGIAVSSGTIDTRRGIVIQDGTGAGTITNQVGIRIVDLTKGATLNIALQILGTTSHNRIVPKTNIGSDATPSAQLDMAAGELRFHTTAVTYANPMSIDPTTGNVFTTTTTSAVGNATFNATSAGLNGQIIIFRITNDATAGRTLTFGTNFKPSGTLGTGGTNKTATIMFLSDGAAWWEVTRTNNLA